MSHELGELKKVHHDEKEIWNYVLWSWKGEEVATGQRGHLVLCAMSL